MSRVLGALAVLTISVGFAVGYVTAEPGKARSAVGGSGAPPIDTGAPMDVGLGKFVGFSPDTGTFVLRPGIFPPVSAWTPANCNTPSSGCAEIEVPISP